jgi:UDP-N-acetylglucosamine--N-acetylmuramyl-(pentapeptide) pyrophosphoryl-undecaprenol N-acetylglucosamine transferase
MNTSNLTPIILVSAGGTGGHIIPTLSVSKKLLEKGAEVHYIGSKEGLEYEIISKSNESNEHPKIIFHHINVQKLYRKFTFKHLFFPFKLLKSIFICLKYFKTIKPHAFIGFGGYISGPPAIAARLLKCPLFIQEQNCRPGITNKAIGKYANGVFLACEESKRYFNNNKTHITGNPVNITILNNKSKTTKHKLGDNMFNFRTNSKKLFILGGSQGSLFMNELILEHIDWLYDNNIDLIWQTGKNQYETIKGMVESKYINYESGKSRAGRSILMFGFSNSISELYTQTDFVISRGGAMSLAEIEVYKIPAFIIPLETAAVNEQYYNAIYMQKRNMGMVFEQRERNHFIERFTEFLEKAPQMYKEVIEESPEKSLHLTAADTIAQIVLANTRKVTA